MEKRTLFYSGVVLNIFGIASICPLNSAFVVFGMNLISRIGY